MLGNVNIYPANKKLLIMGSLGVAANACKPDSEEETDMSQVNYIDDDDDDYGDKHEQPYTNIRYTCAIDESVEDVAFMSVAESYEQGLNDENNAVDLASLLPQVTLDINDINSCYVIPHLTVSESADDTPTNYSDLVRETKIGANIGHYRCSVNIKGTKFFEYFGMASRTSDLECSVVVRSSRLIHNSIAVRLGF